MLRVGVSLFNSCSGRREQTCALVFILSLVSFGCLCLRQPHGRAIEQLVVFYIHLVVISFIFVRVHVSELMFRKKGRNVHFRICSVADELRLFVWCLHVSLMILL